MLTTILLPVLISATLGARQVLATSAQPLKPLTRQCALISSAMFQHAGPTEFDIHGYVMPSQQPSPYGDSIGNAAQDGDGSIDPRDRDQSDGATMPFDSNTGDSLAD